MSVRLKPLATICVFFVIFAVIAYKPEVQKKDGDPGNWSAEDVTRFTRSCTALGQTPRICSCYVKKLSQHYSASEANRMSSDPQKEKSTLDDIVRYMRECAATST